jgi:hypothetical protein
MGEVAGSKLKVPFTWDDPKRGRLELLVSPLSFGMEAVIQRRLEERALLAVQRHRELMSLADYQIAWDGWRRDCATGVYEYGGMACFQWMHTTSGWCYRALVMLREKCPDVTPEMVERVAADPGKFKELDESRPADPPKNCSRRNRRPVAGTPSRAGRRTGSRNGWRGTSRRPTTTADAGGRPCHPTRPTTPTPAASCRPGPN